MTTRAYLMVSILFFALILIGHLLRLVQGWPVVIGTMSLPLWSSVLAVLIGAAGVIWGLSLLRRV